MNSPYKFSLSLPLKNGGNQNIETNESILIIGANGAGKTRLGTWIEFTSPQNKLVHRIGASKSLAMPNSTTPKSIELASNHLLFGYENINPGEEQHHKTHSKYGSKPATFLQNDFERLMTFLFSDETEENAKYKAAQKESKEKIDPPITRLDVLKQIWEKILPHRQLIIGGLRIETKATKEDAKTYNASEMSDGERVIFYLIGQCLAAPKNGIIVIDEPELHLHKSIQQPLWNEIEKQREDCLFVYLTHDVSFAAGKSDSKNIWLKSYDGNTWDWEVLNDDDNLPHELLLEIVGSRQPILFVEGENGGHDSSLYRAILPKYLVIPRGSCEQVIQSVKAFKLNSQLIQIPAIGLIDKDRRSSNEISHLESHGIYVLKVAEVENLFCTKELIEIISKRLGRTPADDFESIKKEIFNRLSKELETQVSARVSSEIKYKLNTFDVGAKGLTDINTALQSLISEINVEKIYTDTNGEFEKIIANTDYEALLDLYNRKSLIETVGKELGLASKEYAPLVIRLANAELHSEISDSLKKYLGNLPDK